MNRDRKAAIVDEVAAQIEASEAVFAVDYRGISVPQAAQLRSRLNEAGAGFRVVKNTLTNIAAAKAGAEELKALLEGPTAFTFVPEGGDVALAAKALATFRREHRVLAFKGGRMNGDALTADELEALSRLPARDVLHGQLVGVLASPLTGLARGLDGLVSGLAIALGQIAEQGLVGAAAPVAEPEAPAAEAPAAEGSAAEEPAAGQPPAEEPAAEGSAAEQSAVEQDAVGQDATSYEPATGSDESEPTDAPVEGAPTDSEEA
ncbi:MAG: 50S ribosomal protein L10 [Actinomycetota bacterium]|nr:50S ribosomal protein L10 [Actinomycetota bacterium]